MRKTIHTSLFLLLAFSLKAIQSGAQQMPYEYSITPDGRMLMLGKKAHAGFYDQSLVRRIDIQFPSASFWTQLTNNYVSKTYLPGTVTIDGQVFDSAGVRFRGNTSYQTGTSQKKSFKIELDNWRPGSDFDGYSTLKLNNAHQDPSMMREVFYTNAIRRHVPTAKSSFVKLYLNGSNWGLYSNIQQLNKDFLEEWYFSNDGIWWRADRPPGSSGPGGGWGDGTAGLNFLSTDTNSYKPYYTLKESNGIANPWSYLVRLCEKLNTTPSAALADTLEKYMDIDRTLWFLASELAWTDDDSYVFKGKMDYYVYFDEVTGLMAPHEYDGNSSLEMNPATTWGVFYNATNPNYPLLNKLLNVPSLRQRYLAHMRTIIAEEFDTAFTNATFNAYRALVDTIVQNDPKKMYSYTQYNSEVQVLRNFVTTRKNFLNSNSEIQQVAPIIADAPYFTSGVMYQQPADMQPVTVRSRVTSGNGIDNVQLYYSDNIAGRFTKTPMFDDGQHDDSLAADGIYGAQVPGFTAGTFVRYYIEAVAGNTAKSVRYLPAGAEHDVFIYTVAPMSSADTAVVINEIMANNISAQTDDFGELEDWIELYNKSTAPADLSGYFLTDNPLNLAKWEIPSGTVLQPNDYLILWADEDSSQGLYHTNFKLSSLGEVLFLLDPALNIVDSLSWGPQSVDIGLARVPNGTGPFINQTATFAANNNLNTSVTEPVSHPVLLSVFPNPASTTVQVQLNDEMQRDLEIYNAVGQMIDRLGYQPYFSLNCESWAPGIYHLRCGEAVRKLVVRH